MNICILSISANIDTQSNFSLAMELLNSLFEDIEYSRQVLTEPFGQGYPSDFLNMVACFSTDLEVDELNHHFKEIEYSLGRTEELKLKKIVPIDLDIIVWNKDILRDDYFKFPFIQDLIAECNFL